MAIISCSATLPFFQARSFFEGGSTEEISLLAAKTVVIGLSALIIFGSQVAICAVVANVALSLVSRQASASDWFSWDSMVHHLRVGVGSFPMVVASNIVMGLLVWSRGPVINQVAISLLRKSLDSFRNFFRVFLHITLFAPVVEEIFFRGFLQEKIRDIQLLFFGKHADSLLNKIVRIFLQAAVFGWCHFDREQEGHNVFIVLGTMCSGVFFGQYKEEVNSLWASIGLHWLLNTAVSIRVLLFGG